MAFVQRDRARLTPYMNWQMGRLDSELRSAFGVRLYCTSGIRLAAEQEAIFRARYVTAGNVRGRRVYDTRMWRGVRWYRISSAGTVATPGNSNHEIQGTKAAVDIRDTGADAGISVRGSRRGKWMRANAHRFGLIASGDGFGEGWHFDVLNVFAAVPGAPTTSNPGNSHTPTAPAVPTSEEDTVTVSIRLNKKHLYAIGAEFISHHGTDDQAETTRKIMTVSDELHDVNTTQFRDLLDGLGIPRDVVNIDKGWVKNPETDKYESNAVWSRNRQAVQKLGLLLGRVE
jgi:hypothetical protein